MNTDVQETKKVVFDRSWGRGAQEVCGQGQE